MRKIGWSLQIIMSILRRLDTFSKGTSQRCDHLSFNFDQWMAGVSFATSSSTYACNGAINRPLRLTTESYTRRDCFWTSVLPVPAIVKFNGCPFNSDSFAAASVMYELVEQGFLLDSFFRSRSRQGKPLRTHCRHCMFYVLFAEHWSHKWGCLGYFVLAQRGVLVAGLFGWICQLGRKGWSRKSKGCDCYSCIL